MVVGRLLIFHIFDVAPVDSSAGGLAVKATDMSKFSKHGHQAEILYVIYTMFFFGYKQTKVNSFEVFQTNLPGRPIIHVISLN